MKSLWIKCQLGNIVTFQRGYDLPRSKMSGYGYPVVGSNGIIGFHNEYTTSTPSITVGRSGNVGNPFIVYGNTWSHNTTLFIKEFKNSVPVFVYYYLKTLDLENYAGGSAVPTLNRNHIHSLPVFIPSCLSEQQAIASILKSFDDKIAFNTRINDNLEQQGSILVKQYFSSIDKKIPLAEIMSFENGFPFQSKTYLKNGKYRIVTIKNVQDGRLEIKETPCIDILPDKMKSGCVLQMGDILLSLTGNVGRVAAVCEDNLLLNQRVAKVIPNKKSLSALVYFVLRQPSLKAEMETISRGTAQLNLSPIETSQLKIPYESSSAHDIAEELSPLYSLIVNHSHENTILATIRDALLPRLMSGELDVSEIDL